MTAILQAKLLCLANGRDLNRDFNDYLDCGCVLVLPDMLALWRPAVRTDWKRWATRNEADMWFVHLAVGRGSLRELLRHIPYPLPWIGWHRQMLGRDSSLHVVSTARLFRALNLNF